MKTLNKILENIQDGYHPVKGDKMLCKICGRKADITVSGKGPLVCCGQPMVKVG